MLETDTYRRQHDDLLDLMEQISVILSKARFRKELSKLHSLLNQLNGRFSVHLAMEDESLYPSLQEHPDEMVRTVAGHFMGEMGGLFDKFKRYMNTWKLSNSIINDQMEFIRQTERLMDMIKNRIERENSELYPLAEGKQLSK